MSTAGAPTADRSPRRPRRRTLVLIGVLVVALLLAYPAVRLVQTGRRAVAAAAADCGPVRTYPAFGNGDHRPDGSPIVYRETPPVSGPHYTSPAPPLPPLYGPDDRPAIGTLVHNLEHGYTVAWYRADAPTNQVAALRHVASTVVDGGSGRPAPDPAKKFIAAPWREADGPGFPSGATVVLARWTADPDHPEDRDRQRGVERACARVSGQVVADFMARYPVSASPEPDGA